MNNFSVVKLLCLSFGLLTSTMAFMEQEEDNTDNMLATLESAHYHLGEFQKSVNQFSSLQRRSSRTKRDERRAEEIQKIDFLFNSLIDFCFRIQNFGELTENSTSEEDNTWTTTTTNASTPTTTATVATTTSTTNTTTSPSGSHESLKMNETEEEPWEFPKVRPLRVDAVRDSGKIHLLFHVNHSAPVEITRLAAFDMQKTVLDEVDESKGMIQSLSSFNVLTSGYCGEDYEIPNTFVFESRSKPDNSVSLKIDVCGEQQHRRNQSTRLERFRRQVDVDVTSVHIRLPKFRIDSNSAESIIAFPGMNTTVDVSVEPNTMTFMIVSGIFHDRAAKKMVKDEYWLDFNNGDFNIIRLMSPETPELFSISISDSTNTSIHDTSETDMQNEPENMKKQIPVSITLFTDSGQMAGKLYLEATKVYGSEDQHELIQSVSVDHVILVKKPGNRRVFSRRRVYIEDQTMFTCSEKGNENQSKIGTHCTLSCSATGRGIADISIFKGNSNGTIYQSLSYKTSDRISTVVDLGTYSSDINGWYVCSVTDGKGKEHTQDLLLNVGAPKIDVNNTSLLDLENGTTLVVCAIDGKPPMNVSVEINYSFSEGVRVDDAITSVRTQVEAKDDVLLTVALPTENISYPADSVICIASSDLGYDNHSIDLPDIETTTTTSTVTDADVTQKPQIISKKSKIVNLDDGSTSVTCTAKGASRLEAVVSSANNSASFNLDDIPGRVRLEETIEGGQSVTWIVARQHVIETSFWLYCVAMNSYGVDFFKLSTQSNSTDTL